MRLKQGNELVTPRNRYGVGVIFNGCIGALALWCAILLAEQGKFVYDSHEKVDPFFPIVSEEGDFLVSFVVSEAPEKVNLILEGIVWDAGGDSLAIINGVMVRKGEWLNNYKVIQIENDRVTLGDGEQTVQLILEVETEK